MTAAPSNASDTGEEGNDREPALLGVETSLQGKRWQSRGFDPDLAVRIKAQISQNQAADNPHTQMGDMPDFMAGVIAARILNVASLDGFLNPSLRATLPDPSSLVDMDKAAARLADAIQNPDEQVAVFADYDVDGATSAALLVRYFAALGKPLRTYVPDRVAEGYGPNAVALGRLADEGARLIICVDCGIAAHEAFAALAHSHPDCQIVVLDHHQADEVLPAAHALVNPNRLDDLSGMGELAAVGVTFLALVALNRTLRDRGAFAEVAEPDLLSLLGLVAFGTVADVVPLRGLNRAFVTQGLRVLQRGDNAGLTALAQIANVHGKPSVYHLGFALGPRINAGGRVGRADLGVRLLTTSNADEADALAAELERLNRERQSIEAAALASALEEANEAITEEASDILVVAGANWHPGIVGLVASRLKDRFSRPVIAISLGKDGVAKGSARSMTGVDIGGAIRAAAEAGVITSGGGHGMAAGLTMEAGRLHDLRAFLAEHVGSAARQARANDSLSVDAMLSAGGASETLMGWLDLIGPFGAGNPEPRFVFPSQRVAFVARAGDTHLRLTLKGGDGARLDAMAFRAVGTEMGEALLAHDGATMHFAGKLKRDTWVGRGSSRGSGRGGNAARLKLFIDDVAPARA